MTKMEIMIKRSTLQTQIVKSLEHMDRDRALNLILAWFSLNELRNMIPTITGGEEPKA